MNVLILSDLHIYNNSRIMIHKKHIDKLCSEYDPDVICITGDIFESSFDFNRDPYKTLNHIVSDRTTICTLGNHEFWDRTVEGTHKHYRDNYDPDQYDIHYLDIIGSHDVKGINFFGNVLWFDGSMACLGQKIDEFAGGTWNDKRIMEFDWQEENKKCVKQIFDNQGNEWDMNILLTHAAPHTRLNEFMTTQPFSHFNAYSGMTDLLEDVNADWCFCGHTHRRVVGVNIAGTNCVNIGNNYSPPFQHYFLEV